MRCPHCGVSFRYRRFYDLEENKEMFIEKTEIKPLKREIKSYSGLPVIEAHVEQDDGVPKVLHMDLAYEHKENAGVLFSIRKEPEETS